MNVCFFNDLQHVCFLAIYNMSKIPPRLLISVGDLPNEMEAFYGAILIKNESMKKMYLKRECNTSINEKRLSCQKFPYEIICSKI